MTDAQAGGDRQRRQHMGGIEYLGSQLVADIGPGHFAHQLDLQVFAFGEIAFHCGDGDGRVHQRDKAYAQGLHRGAFHLNAFSFFRISAAMSLMRRFSFMAALRIRA